MDNDRRLTRVMVVLCNGVHGVIGVGPFLVDAHDGAVPYGAAIVLSDFRAYGNRLECSFLRGRHCASPLVPWSRERCDSKEDCPGTN